MWAATECPASGNGPSTKVEDKKRTWSGVAVLSLCSLSAFAEGCPFTNSTLVHFDINNESRCDVNACRCLSTCYPQTFACEWEDWFTIDGHKAKWWQPWKPVTCTVNGLDTEISIIQTESPQVQAQTILLKAPKGHHRNNVTSCAYVIGRPEHLEDRFDKDALKGDPNDLGFYDVTPKVELYRGWAATENEKTLFYPVDVERTRRSHESRATLRKVLELVKSQAEEDGVDYVSLIFQPKAFIPEKTHYTRGEHVHRWINHMMKWMGNRFAGITSIMFSYEGEPPSRNKTDSWEEKCHTKNDYTDWAFWGKLLGGTAATAVVAAPLLTLAGKGIAKAVRKWSNGCTGPSPSFRRDRSRDGQRIPFIQHMELQDAQIELQDDQIESKDVRPILKNNRTVLGGVGHSTSRPLVQHLDTGTLDTGV